MTGTSEGKVHTRRDMRAEDVIEDIWTQVDNFNRLVTRDPVKVLSKIEEICTRWGEDAETS
jgi:hypothetical protein